MGGEFLGEFWVRDEGLFKDRRGCLLREMGEDPGMGGEFLGEFWVRDEGLFKDGGGCLWGVSFGRMEGGICRDEKCLSANIWGGL